MVDNANMTYETSRFDALDMHKIVPSPGSPPGMSSSKSSKTSSVRSFGSDDDNSVLADAGHFEEIGLDDDTITIDNAHSYDINQPKTGLNPYSSSFATNLRAQTVRHVGPRILPVHTINTRDLARPRSQRDITSTQKTRPKFPVISTQFRDTSTQGLNSIGPQRHTSPLPIRSLSARSASAVGANRRHRSPSPNLSMRSLSPRDPNIAPRPRRGSWQSALERKSVIELEKECDDDDDNIPEGFILDNIPISPRPPVGRPVSRPVSASTSPDRQTKERIRSVGNGTPAVAVAHGSLRSPSWRSEASSTESIKSPGVPSPVKGRAKSWNSALSELSAEAKALTEKLEEHAEVLDKNGVFSHVRSVPKPRVKSALAELPPLRRTNIMIDPLPISKEKEAVLSRTRPSWLPPKDPAEEKKHLKEYQRMMANSIEADKRYQLTRKEKGKTKDAVASNLTRIWEDDVLKRWNDAIRERRTRELWWKGVAPRARGTVWSQAIGNELGLTETSFQAALGRANEVETRVTQGNVSTEDERKAQWFKNIRADAESNTWNELNIFQAGGPLHQSLIDVLSAYAMYRSDIGYVDGSNVSIYSNWCIHPHANPRLRPLQQFCFSICHLLPWLSSPWPMCSTGHFLYHFMLRMMVPNLLRIICCCKHCRPKLHNSTSTSPKQGSPLGLRTTSVMSLLRCSLNIFPSTNVLDYGTSMCLKETPYLSELLWHCCCSERGLYLQLPVARRLWKRWLKVVKRRFKAEKIIGCEASETLGKPNPNCCQDVRQLCVLPSTLLYITCLEFYGRALGNIITPPADDWTNMGCN